MTAPANPILVEVSRAETVESRHRGAAVVARADGTVVASWGEVAAPVFPRSAAKPLQALPLIETGAAERFGVSDEEIALACASHRGEPVHTRALAAWLKRMGLSAEDLECGASPPKDEETAAAMIGAGQSPSPLHNNCSGKHAGFLATALHMGEKTAGYIQPGHPVQKRWRGVLQEMGGAELAEAAAGVDGCGIPVVAMPLAALARAMARLADPSGLPSARRRAARRVLAAMTAHPYLVRGRGGFDTLAIEAGAGALVVKTGAEGVHAAALPGPGLGVALKIDDGARRAAETAMAALLAHLGAVDKKAKAALAPFLASPVNTFAGTSVGCVRPAKGWL
ncbi:MAG: asparaginase [Rhodospirillales bacterium]